MSELIESTANLFKLMSDPTRLSILHLICEAPLNVSAICERLSLSQSVVSHQLQKLKAGHLVTSYREGKMIIYSPADEHVLNLIKQGMEHSQELF